MVRNVLFPTKQQYQLDHFFKMESKKSSQSLFHLVFLSSGPLIVAIFLCRPADLLGREFSNH
jgi:hypothetical protein